MHRKEMMSSNTQVSTFIIHQFLSCCEARPSGGEDSGIRQSSATFYLNPGFRFHVIKEEKLLFPLDSTVGEEKPRAAGGHGPE